MKDLAYYIRELPNGKHLAEIGDDKGAMLEFHQMTDEQTLNRAAAFEDFAAWMRRHVAECQERRERA